MITNTSRGRGPSEAGELHRRQIRDIIRALRSSGNVAPTLEELSSRSRLSKSTVRHHLGIMEQRGTLKIGQLRRELILIEPGEGEAP